MRKVILLGAGGHSRVLRDVLHLNGVAVHGIVTSNWDTLPGTVFQVPVLGDDTYLERLSPEEYDLVNGVGGIIDSLARQRVYDHGRGLGFSFRSVIHPRTCVAEDVELGDGVQVMAGAVIQPGTRVGSNSIVNTSSSIDHDCRIGAHVHVAPGVTLSGGVEVGDGTHIGTGACVIQGIRIASRCFVAAGAVVVRDLAMNARVAGVPARESLL